MLLPLRMDGSGWEEGLAKECLRLAELPGLLMNSNVSMASCSRTFCGGEKRMGSTTGVPSGRACGVACMGLGCPGVWGLP